MYLRYLLAAFFILAVQLAVAQTPDSNTRPPFELKLKINDTSAFSAPVPKTMYVVSEGILQLFPGDEIFVEVDLRKDSLVNLKVVPAAVNKDKTVKVSFSQTYEGNKHKQMMLTVVNPFAKNLTYKAQISVLNREGWENTSIIPVSPKIASYELWPYPIVSILLTDFCLKDI